MGSGRRLGFDMAADEYTVDVRVDDDALAILNDMGSLAARLAEFAPANGSKISDTAMYDFATATVALASEIARGALSTTATATDDTA